MDIHKVAAVAQILCFPTGAYCAYGTYVALHPEVGSPVIFNSTALAISFGAFGVCLLIGFIVMLAPRLKRVSAGGIPSAEAFGKGARLTFQPMQEALAARNAEVKTLREEVQSLKNRPEIVKASLVTFFMELWCVDILTLCRRLGEFSEEEDARVPLRLVPLSIASNHVRIIRHDLRGNIERFRSLTVTVAGLGDLQLDKLNDQSTLHDITSAVQQVKTRLETLREKVATE